MTHRFTISILVLITAVLYGGEGRHGEEARNKARHAWFAEQRGLYDIARPGLMRRQALHDLKRRPCPKRVAQAAWTSLGPHTAVIFDWRMGRVAGRVASLAVHPLDSDILYLGSGSGGLWKTVDGGDAWTPLFDDIGALSIGALYIDPDNPDTIWAGTGDHTQVCAGYFGMGLFRSTDGGANWNAMNGGNGNLLSLSYIAAVTKTAGGVMLAGGHAYCDNGTATDGGLFRSTDNGANWTQVLTGSVGDIVPHPTDPNLVYAAVGRFSASENGIYRSTDAGQTWSRLENGIDFGSTVGRTRLALAPSEPTLLYALVNHSNDVTSLFRTQDGGNTWTERNTNACEGQCWYNLCLAVDPTNSVKLLVGSIRFAYSDNGGFALIPQVDTWGATQLVHQDVHVLTFDRNDPNRYWVGTDGGLWRTDNGGDTFINRNSGLPITQLFDVAVRPDDPARVYGGSMDNASMRTNGEALWRVTFNNGDGTNNYVDPLDHDIVFQAGVPVAGFPRLIRSTTGGNPGSFQSLPLTGVDGTDSWPFKMPITGAANLAETQTHYFIGSHRVYRSDDGGNTWLPLSPASLGGGRISVIVAQATKAGMTVYAGTNNGRIYRTDNGLAATPTWQEVTNAYPGQAVTDIALDPGDHQRAWVTRGGFGAARLYHTIDGGLTWTPKGADLPDVPANTVALDPNDPTRIFVGTDVGVFESLDSGTSFAPMDAGMPAGLLILDLEVTGDVMTAASYGRGAWRISLERLVLTVDAGVGEELCSKESVVLTGVAGNGVAPLSWSWAITEGPDTDAAQLTGADSKTPTFTPTQPGTYTLRVALMDADTDFAEDTLVIQVGDDRAFLRQQATHWLQAPGETPVLDRDDSGLMDIRDLILQVGDPLCPAG